MDSMRNFYRRQKQVLMARNGRADLTVDETFEALSTEFEARQKVTVRLYENLAALEGCVRTTVGVMHLIADDLQVLLDESSSLYPLVQAFKATSSDMYEKLGNQIADAMNQKCGGTIGSLFPEAKRVRTDMRERRDAQLDYDARRTKLAELVRKSGGSMATVDQAKLQRYRIKESSTRDTYNRKNQQVIGALQIFDASTTDACNATFADLVSLMGQFVERAATQLKPIATAVQTQGRPAPVRQQVQERVEATLANPQNDAFANSFADMHSEFSNVQPQQQQQQQQQMNYGMNQSYAVQQPIQQQQQYQQPQQQQQPMRMAVPVQQAAPVAVDPTASVGDEFFYLDDENAQFGPVTFAQLKQAFASRRIHQGTLVYGHGMPNWQEIQQYPILLNFLRS
eukprot:ANDGO_01433.mRNA.1 hypothetical protein